MKKIFFIALGLSLSCLAYAQPYDSLSQAVQSDVDMLSEEGCSINITGIISREISTDHYQIFIPTADCDINGSKVKAYDIKRDSNGKWGEKIEANDTSVEKVTDYGGMASVTEHIEYTSSKTEFYPAK